MHAESGVQGVYAENGGEEGILAEEAGGVTGEGERTCIIICIFFVFS
jgi:hypothetical protein